ncbi:hypothetical protein ACHAWF_009505 [Thalassiosira exigua]
MIPPKDAGVGAISPHYHVEFGAAREVAAGGRAGEFRSFPRENSCGRQRSFRRASSPPKEGHAEPSRRGVGVGACRRPRARTRASACALCPPSSLLLRAEGVGAAVRAQCRALVLDPVTPSLGSSSLLRRGETYPRSEGCRCAVARWTGTRRQS